nr:YetF domain-containing protein [uncultured Devosia sp.]
MEQASTAFDVQRMLFGDEPPLFLLEIAFRTIVIYAYTLLLLRWLGSRTVGQLSTVEFLLVIALGSAVGDAMFYPDVPLLHAMLVVTIVVVANKGLDLLIARSKKAEEVIDGKPREVVRDGVLTSAFLASRTVSREELFQQLREDGIEQLGEVWRAYIEKDGQLTVFRTGGTPPAGLRIVPPSQIKPHHLFEPLTGSDTTLAICATCGHSFDGEMRCHNCGASRWTAASSQRIT